VTDTPTVLRDVEEFINRLNHRMTKMVAISTQVYAVSRNDSSEVGINWTGVFANLAGKYKINFSTPALSTGLGTMLFSLVDPTGTSPWNGSQAIAGALASTGHTALITHNDTTTLSGYAVPVQNTAQQAFVESAQTTAVANAGVSTQITEGVINSGLTLNMIPIVMDDNRVLLQTSMDLTSNDGLVPFTSGGQTVQLPNTSSKNFQNSVVMASGQTMILTGFDQNGGALTKSGLLNPGNLFEGGSDKGTINHSTLVMVVSIKVM
jgi:type IVB pilus formation R64 PilN family outer membrane protein